MSDICPFLLWPNFGFTHCCYACMLLPQINTPGDQSDYFLPLRFDVRDSENNISDDLLAEMYTGLRTPAGVRPDIDTK